MIGPVRTINFSITSRCNRKCPACVSGLQRDHRERRDQTLQEIEAAAKILGPVEIICLYGGEPSLHSQFRELTACMRDVFDAYQIVVATNGYGFSRFPEAFLGFDYILASVYTPRTYPGCPSNIADVEAFRSFLRARGQEDKLKASDIIHTPDRPPYGGLPCYREEMPTISYFSGKLYRCCTGEGIPGAIGIPLTSDWRREIVDVPIPCGNCLFSGRA